MAKEWILNSAMNRFRPMADFYVEPEGKVSGETYFSDAEKSDIIECTTVKISSLGEIR